MNYSPPTSLRRCLACRLTIETFVFLFYIVAADAAALVLSCGLVHDLSPVALSNTELSIQFCTSGGNGTTLIVKASSPPDANSLRNLTLTIAHSVNVWLELDGLFVEDFRLTVFNVTIQRLQRNAPNLLSVRRCALRSSTMLLTSVLLPSDITAAYVEESDVVGSSVEFERVERVVSHDDNSGSMLLRNTVNFLLCNVTGSNVTLRGVVAAPPVNSTGGGNIVAVQDSNWVHSILALHHVAIRSNADTTSCVVRVLGVRALGSRWLLHNGSTLPYASVVGVANTSLFSTVASGFFCADATAFVENHIWLSDLTSSDASPAFAVQMRHSVLNASFLMLSTSNVSMSNLASLVSDSSLHQSFFVVDNTTMASGIVSVLAFQRVSLFSSEVQVLRTGMVSLSAPFGFWVTHCTFASHSTLLLVDSSFFGASYLFVLESTDVSASTLVATRYTLRADSFVWVAINVSVAESTLAVANTSVSASLETYAFLLQDSMLVASMVAFISCEFAASSLAWVLLRSTLQT